MTYLFIKSIFSIIPISLSPSINKLFCSNHSRLIGIQMPCKVNIIYGWAMLSKYNKND